MTLRPLLLPWLLLAACDKSATPSAPPAAPPAAATAEPAGRGFVLTELKPSQGELGALLAAEVAKAKAKNLKPFLEVSATWCGPCQKLKQSLDQPVMTDAFRGTYIVTVDLDTWEAALTKIGYPVKVVPIFFKVGEGGKPTGKSLDGGAWKNDVPDEMAPPLKRFFNS